MNSTKTKKALKISAGVLTYLFLALCIFSVLFVLLGKDSRDGAVKIFGKKMMIVTTDSMAPCDGVDVSGYDVGSIPKGTLIFIDTVPDDPEDARAFYDSLKEGDVLTFRYVYANQITITHRLMERDPIDGGYILTLIGDNKNSDQTLLTQTIDTSDANSLNYVIGRVTGTSRALGAVISLLRTPIALVLLVILPSLAIMFIEIARIIRVVSDEKRRRESEAQKEELDALRRRIAELEGDQKDANADVEADTGKEEDK